MLWLCIALPQLPLEALHCELDDPVVVTMMESNARWVICCNPAAEQAHLGPGMNCTVALAVHPQLTMIERRERAEQAALERLAAWAYQFSSRVVLGEIQPQLGRARGATLWLEIGASLRLFGGLRTLIASLECELDQLGYSYQLGIGPTLEGAALLARAEIRMAITTPGALRARIRPLPIARLALAPEIAQQLHTSGVRTIGVLLDLPRDALARRFGAQLGDFLDRLTGRAADPRPMFRVPDHYQAGCEFEFEVKSTEALLFPLRRMLHELAGFLRARDTAVQRFTVTLTHRTSPATRLHVGLSTPERDAQRFFSLVREQLERVELPAPTTQLDLSAEEFAAPTALQSDFFSSALQHSEQFSHTIDRIAARLGERQVQRLAPVADHRPEAAWASAPGIAQGNATNAAQPGAHFPQRPLWLLPEPKPLHLSAIPQVTAGPERIEGGWWDQGDLRRDYYIVRTSNGADLWVYRDLTDRSWYLHGFWS
jgi:protein ImuB